MPARSVLPQDARPAPVVSLQRVGFAAWARGPTLLVATADCRVCIYRRAARPCMRRPRGPVRQGAWLPDRCCRAALRLAVLINNGMRLQI